MKKQMTVMTALFLGGALLMNGCGVIELTDQESDMIAQYSAGALLNHSEEYEDRLIVSTSSPVPSSQPTASPDLAATPVAPTQEPAVDGAEGGDGEPVATETPQVALDDIYQVAQCSFSYKNYEFCSQYPKHSDMYQILANSDEVLLVVKFDVKNQGNSKKKIDLVERKISYPLTIGEMEYKPTISVLENGGLNYLSTTIKPGKTEEAVLVYALPKREKSAETMELKIQDQDKDKESTISLK